MSQDSSATPGSTQNAGLRAGILLWGWLGFSSTSRVGLRGLNISGQLGLAACSAIAT
jgi:hypothetical protein